MASKHHGDNDDLADQLQPLVDDDAFLTELSQGKDPSNGSDELAGLLLGLKGDIDKQMPPAPRVDGVEEEPEVVSLNKVRSRRRNRPVMHGLIGAAAATVILAGAGGVMVNSGASACRPSSRIWCAARSAAVTGEASAFSVTATSLRQYGRVAAPTARTRSITLGM